MCVRDRCVCVKERGREVSVGGVGVCKTERGKCECVVCVCVRQRDVGGVFVCKREGGVAKVHKEQTEWAEEFTYSFLLSFLRPVSR